MDPNWFYSTLAQSTAAIVGLAGGFLFSWLLSRRGEAINERCEFIRKFNRIVGKLENLKREADRVRVQVEDALLKIGEQQAAGIRHDDLKIPPFELLSHNSGHIPHPSVEDIANLKKLPTLCCQIRDAIVDDRRELAHALLLAKPLEFKGMPGYCKAKIITHPIMTTGNSPQSFWPGILIQKDFAIWSWQEIAREYDQLAVDLKSFRERLIPRSIYFLVWVLMGLVGAGMIAPMAFLSAHEGPSKWVLFAIFSPLVFAFVGYLAYEVKHLRHAADLSRDTI